MANSPLTAPNETELIYPGTSISSSFQIMNSSQTPSIIIKRNGFVYVNMMIKCLSKSSGSQQIYKVPKPKIDTISGLSWQSYNENQWIPGLIQLLGNDYILYIKSDNCVVNGTYGFNVCYPYV